MKYFLTAVLSFLPYLVSASTDYQYDVAIKAKDLNKIIQAGSYSQGGVREGFFFEDLRNSSTLLKQKEINEFYEDKFPFEIDDYYIWVAIENAKAENNTEIVSALLELRQDYHNEGQLDPKIFKQKFIEVLSHQFDLRIQRLVIDFTNRLQKHGGNYTAMLTEYQPVLESIEQQKLENGLKKFILFTAFSGAGFVTVFMGIPLLIPFLLPL